MHFYIHFSLFQHLTLRACRWLVVFLWLLPTLGILSPFLFVPGQGVQSPNCSNYSFLGRLPFRATFSTLIVAPTAAILVLYLHFHCLLWRRRDVSRSSSVSRQNIRAARVTFLIMLTCTLGWLPAVTNHLLICEDGCRYSASDFSHSTLFVVHAVGYVLVILKSFTNPLIFAFRQSNIQHALIRLVCRFCCCCCLREEDLLPQAIRHRPSSRYSSFTYRSSVHRGTHRRSVVNGANTSFVNGGSNNHVGNGNGHGNTRRLMDVNQV